MLAGTGITTMTTIRRMTEAAWLRLLAWLSPAFPTGGFAWSQGVEWAVEAGDVADEASLRDWLEDVLRHGAGRTDAILLRHAHAAQADAAALADISQLARAVQPGRERLAETLGQGNAFALAAAAWGADVIAGIADLPYPVALGALAGAHGIDADAACAGFLQASSANMISAAVRLVPLGQSAGLRVLAGLEAVFLAVAAGSRGAALDDVGGACFRADLAVMRHETQYTRLFRS
jgi:urease accessory protein